MKKTKLDELLKSGAVTEEEYKELLPTCEDDTGEPEGGESNPEDPLAGLDEKTRAAVEKMESPPRMRGKPLCVCCEAVRCGITPAHAGKTTSILPTPTAYRDHPRVCGENVDDVLAKGGQQGSPPRVRGKLYVRHPSFVVTGITPAYAGKTGAPVDTPSPPRDHPRVCGENCASAIASALRLGSPPRMRGKL